MGGTGGARGREGWLVLVSALGVYGTDGRGADVLGQLVVGEGVCVSALAVELFLGEGGGGIGLVGFAVFFSLLAFGWGRHWGGDGGHVG